ncbi:LPXTG cell wall anchor domain-containing protein [Buchananella felis]|uniref:LPXTG cell wall anchor domain-containing protein n=1 Tax=Buchananella felis TaxID=3231492 RepID=UPI0035279175
MLRKLGAALAACALAITVHATASADSGPVEPKTPVVTLTPATCENKTNRVRVDGFNTDEAYKKQYRFVIEVKGRNLPVKQLSGPERAVVLAGNEVDIATLLGGNASLGYGKEVTVKAYWFNNKAAPYKYPQSRRTTVDLEYGPDLTNATLLGASNPFTLVNPATLNCTPLIATAPAAPTFELAAAKCEAGQVIDNVMTVDVAQKHANYRFVATHDGKSISLKQELRQKLWTEGKLSAADIKAAYPSFVFDYTKPISVQAYWFDAEQAYQPSLYDTALALTAGQSDRFIKLGDAKELTLVDPATLNCTPLIATAPAAPTFELAAAKCEAGQVIDNVMTVDVAQKHANYRFVATHDGKSISLKQELRQKLWTEGKLSAADIKAAYPSFVFDYTKPISVQAYWFDAEQAYQPSLYDTALALTAGQSDRFIKLGDAKELTLVDPATLNCTPLIATPPAAPTFELAAAKCEAGQVIDNVMTVDVAQKHANYRFVATHDGKSISLKQELRQKLWTEGKLSAADIKAAYPSFVFDYTKPISVQAYWFDAEQAYQPSLYDTALALTAGQSDRFIKLGDAKELTLVDPATLNCTPTPAPSESATPAPSESATPAPSESATPAPSESATAAPSESATAAPSESATPNPSVSGQPGGNGTEAPGDNSSAGAQGPSLAATDQPTVKPTVAATQQASAQPSTPAKGKGKGKTLAKTGFDQGMIVLTLAVLLGAGATMAISRRRNER